MMPAVPAAAKTRGRPSGRDGVVGVAVEVFERDRVELYRGAVALPERDALVAREVELAPVRREARVRLAEGLERHLLLLASARGDEVNVGRARRVRLREGDPLAVGRPRGRADVPVARRA